MTTPRHTGKPSDQPRWIEVLRDRSEVLIRPIHRIDREAERAFIGALPLDENRIRFFGRSAHPSDLDIDSLTDIDYVHEMAFVAVVREDAHERIVGVSRYRTDRDVLTCECSVFVAPAWQAKGLGVALMRHLIETARNEGIRRMFAFDTFENLQVRDLACFLGFEMRIDPDHPERVIFGLDLVPSDAATAEESKC